MYNKTILLVLYLFFAALIQSTLLARLSWGKFFPNFVLIIVLIAALKFSFRSSFLAALVGGLFFDFFSSGKIGVFTLSFLLLVVFVFFIFRILLDKESIINYALVSLSAVLAYSYYFLTMESFPASILVVFVFGLVLANKKLKLGHV